MRWYEALLFGVQAERDELRAENERLLEAAAERDELRAQLAHTIRWLGVIADGTCKHRQGLWCSHCRAQNALGELQAILDGGDQ